MQTIFYLQYLSDIAMLGCFSAMVEIPADLCRAGTDSYLAGTGRSQSILHKLETKRFYQGQHDGVTGTGDHEKSSITKRLMYFIISPGASAEIVKPTPKPG